MLRDNFEKSHTVEADPHIGQLEQAEKNNFRVQESRGNDGKNDER